MISRIEKNIKIYFDKESLYCHLEFSKVEAVYSKKRLLSLLKSKGILIGILEEVIDGIVNKGYLPEVPILVAKGIVPIRGKNGFAEYLIDENPILKKDKFGKVDFYNTGLIKAIVEGEKLARIHPPTSGIPGRNLFNIEISPIEGEEFNRLKLLGENVFLDNSGKYLISAITGSYKLISGKINVVENLDIEGDLNFAVGNFDTCSNVAVKRDIRPGFTMKTENNLVVDGVIEDSTLEVGDNLICKSGICKGKAPITVKNSIRTRYVMNRTNIFCKNLSVESSIFGSRVCSENILEAKKISGSVVYARSKVIANEIGNERYHRTVIELGLTADDLFKMVVIMRDLQKMKEDLKIKAKAYSYRIASIVEVLELKREKLLKSGNNHIWHKFRLEEEKKQRQIADLKDVVLNKRAKIKEMTDTLSYYKLKLKKPDCVVVVKKYVYPNVTIRVNNELEYDVKSRMQNVEFRVNSNGELKPFINGIEMR